jgi:hypothetical protein
MSRSERVDLSSKALTTRRLRESAPVEGAAVDGGGVGVVLAATVGADGFAAAGGGGGGGAGWGAGWKARPEAAKAGILGESASSVAEVSGTASMVDGRILGSVG